MQLKARVAVRPQNSRRNKPSISSWAHCDAIIFVQLVSLVKWKVNNEIECFLLELDSISNNLFSDILSMFLKPIYSLGQSTMIMASRTEI